MSLLTPEVPGPDGAPLKCKSEMEVSRGAVEVFGSNYFYVERNRFEIQKNVVLTSDATDTDSDTVAARPKDDSTRRLSRSRPQCSFETETYSIDFRNLLADKDAKRSIAGIHNLDLLHGTSAIYSLSLPGLEHDTIYKCIHGKDAHTILVLLSMEDAKEHCLSSMKTKDRRKRKEEREKDEQVALKIGDGRDDGKDCSSYEDSEDSIEDSEDSDEYSDDDSEDEYSDGNESDKFDGIFSDFDLSSADEEEDDDSSDELAEMYMETMDDFISKVWKRRRKLDEFFEQQQHKTLQARDIPDELIGIERRLIGCVTYENYKGMLPEKILVITLLSTRRKYMGFGVGKYMLKHIRNPEIAGKNDVIIVNADEGAVKFFEKQGFTTDVLLNSPYEKVHDGWFNTKRMIRFSNFGGKHPTLREMEEITADDAHPLSNLELHSMELEFRLWNEKSVQAHQKLSLNMVRMKNEVYNLNNRIRVKDVELEKLRSELETKEKLIQKERQQARLARSFGKPDGGGFLEKHLVDLNNNDPHEQRATYNNGHVGFRPGNKRTLIQQNVMAAHKLNTTTNPNMTKNVQILKNAVPSVQSFQILLEHIGKIKEKVNQEKDKIHEREQYLLQMLNASNPNQKRKLSLVQQLEVSPQLTARFNAAHSKALRENRRVEDMIYCGKKLTSVDKISSSGFDKNEFTSSRFGWGLHFTKHAHRAAMLTDTDQLVVCKVLLGRCRQLDDVAPSDDMDKYDSVLVRDVDCSDKIANGVYNSSRYVVFDPTHVLPYLIVRYNNNNNN